MHTKKIINKIIWINYCFIIFEILFSRIYSAELGDVIISEFFYKSNGKVYEYIEFYNVSNNQINLFNWEVNIKSPINDTTYISSYSIDYSLLLPAENVVVIVGGYGTDSRFSDGDDSFNAFNDTHYSISNSIDLDANKYYWLSFDLPDDNGVIILKDNYNQVIDSVEYSLEQNFPVGENNYGKSIEYIIDPCIDCTPSSLNDDSRNWRPSSYIDQSLMYNILGDIEFGSPGTINYIPVYSTVPDTVIANSDGYPGSRVLVDILGGGEGCGIDIFEWTSVTDSLYPILSWEKELIDSSGNTTYTDQSYLYFDKYDSVEVISSSKIKIDYTGSEDQIILYKDVYKEEDNYDIMFTAIDSCGISGKQDNSIIIKEEHNEPPIIYNISIISSLLNELITHDSNDTLIVFEGDSIILNANVLDNELCGNISNFCNIDSLKHTSHRFDNSNPFGWHEKNSQLLTSSLDMQTSFLAPIIDPSEDMSANENTKTLDVTFSVTDPFGYKDTMLIVFEVKNQNIPPILNTVIQNRTIIENESFELILEATDYDLDDIEYLINITDEDKTIIDTTYINNNHIVITPKNNYNGLINLVVYVQDNSSISDIQTFQIDVKSINDIPSSFNLYPELNNYDYSEFDSSIYFIDSDSLIYIHLSQEDGLSIDYIPTIRFEWEKNDSLDSDTDPLLSTIETYDLYYRLEAITDDKVIILKDSINSLDDIYLQSVNYYVDINILDEFKYYLASNSYENNSNSMQLDISGKTKYKWRVLAQNYRLDSFGNDPSRIASNWDETSFVIDLIKPEINNINVYSNDIFPQYYDIILESDGQLYLDSTFITINEVENQFEAKENLVTRQISENLYSVTSFIEEEVQSATIIFNSLVRDSSMNSILYIDSISYHLLDPDSSISIYTSSKLVELELDRFFINEPTNIFIVENEIDEQIERSNNNFYQISPTIKFSKNLLLNNKAKISFDIRPYMSDEIFNFQYLIVELDSNESKELITYFDDGIVFTEINKITDYAVFINLDLLKPNPKKFKLGKNYPNPFNSFTIIPIEIPYKSNIKMGIYNILGQEIISLINGKEMLGCQSIKWNGKDKNGKSVVSGIYFVHAELNGKIFYNKIMLLK